MIALLIVIIVLIVAQIIRSEINFEMTQRIIETKFDRLKSMSGDDALHVQEILNDLGREISQLQEKIPYKKRQRKTIDKKEESGIMK